MPLYEYQCTKCKQRFEKIEKVTARRRQKCPNCKGWAERMHSAPAIQFKGAGWYVTDYGRMTAHPSTSTQAGGDTKTEKADKPTVESKEKGEKKEPAKKEQKQK